MFHSWLRRGRPVSMPVHVSTAGCKALRVCRAFLVCLAAGFLLAACGSPPVIRESKLLATGVEKISSIQFIYRNVEMKRTSSFRYGSGAYAANTGFEEFGELLAKTAQPVFEKKKVTLVTSKVIDGKEPIPVNSNSRSPDGGGIPTLVIAPASGSVSANRHATRAEYVFLAQLFDPRSRRLVWTATIDTSTWVGQDFVMKNIEKTVYDENYAAQLLSAVVEQMTRDGMI